MSQNTHISNKPFRRPDPNEGWSRRVEVLRNPIVVPPAERKFVQPAGILRENGSFCAQGAHWRKARPLTTLPDKPEGPVAQLPGTWLWGGVLFRHFGHFLVESSGRLWPIPGLPEKIDGVLFIPKSPGAGYKPEPFHLDFFGMAGVSRVYQADRPLQVEKLYVPGQGFGLGQIIEGTDHARAYFRNHFARNISPDGPEKLYISRSRLGRGRGKILCEDHLDDLLADQGYEVFHPQAHDLPTQIARYKAAKQVVASEGSAIHLFAMVAREHQKLAVVARRVSQATGFILRHARSFAGIEPVLVNTLHRSWVPENETVARLWLSELDFAAAHRALADAGFVSGPTWADPSAEEMEVAKKKASDVPLALAISEDQPV
ncbi:glycosyltransferase family 61 protein [uncultured Pelagimonas sp.]|uniref:glycosyltransferase family 61 protein n=1 Tax=uncultured Pelagimonas sp. TaxID=1618102 RepID=UPI0026245D0D|nr:glycosyltransferase family 61 protein [uncultured Pelagimonas sp.]